MRREFGAVRCYWDLCYASDTVKGMTEITEEIDALRIVPGEDFVTLYTCTPYGINSHRLLVRGRRIERSEERR